MENKNRTIKTGSADGAKKRKPASDSSYELSENFSRPIKNLSSEKHGFFAGLIIAMRSRRLNKKQQAELEDVLSTIGFEGFHPAAQYANCAEELEAYLQKASAAAGEKKSKPRKSKLSMLRRGKTSV